MSEPRLIDVWRGRTVFVSGQPNDILMSEVSDPTNFDYSEALWQQFNSMMEPVPKSLFPSDDDVKPDHVISKPD